MEKQKTNPEPDHDPLRCDACGAKMRIMGHCKYWCLTCGFLRTCMDTV